MADDEPLHPAIRALKTICRCNNIKYKTIERAIREGAHTLSQIADRTTATTGECGGSCTPEVQKLLDELVPRHARQTVATNPGKVPKAAAAEEWWVRKK